MPLSLHRQPAYHPLKIPVSKALNILASSTNARTMLLLSMQTKRLVLGSVPHPTETYLLRLLPPIPSPI